MYYSLEFRYLHRLSIFVFALSCMARTLESLVVIRVRVADPAKAVTKEVVLFCNEAAHVNDCGMHTGNLDTVHVLRDPPLESVHRH